MARHGKNKKGSLQDLILILALLLVFAFAVLIGFKVMTEFNDTVQASTDFDAHGKTASTTLLSYYPGVLDNSFLFLLVVLSIGTWVLAALVRIHPIFIPLFIIAWVFVLFLAGIMSNVYQEMAANTELIALANQMTIMTSIMTFLPIIIGVVGTILMIVQYKNWSNAQ